MRMWMVDPSILCRKHLLGEHVETHMFVGCLRKRMKLDGYVVVNALELSLLKQRHEDLAREMIARGYRHQSPLPDFDTDYLSAKVKASEVDIIKSQELLFGRCWECWENYVRARKEEE